MPLSIGQAANILGVDYDTVWREVNRGRLPAYKVGRVIRIEESALEQYRRDNIIKPAPLAGARKRKSEVWKPGMRL